MRPRFIVNAFSLSFTLAAVGLLTGCAAVEAPADFTRLEASTSTFRLASWFRNHSSEAPVRIYIEGDGYAFNTHGRPSSNPTPKSTLVRRLAFSDPHPNVAYLARPCQYVEDLRCTPDAWTTGRFSQDAVEASAEAVRQLSRGRDVILIGYSGGAQIAGLVAVRHPELHVRKIITVAGNLDHEAWCSALGLAPLSKSLSLRNDWKAFLALPRVHFVGEDDAVISPDLTRSILGPAEDLRIIPGASHSQGWERAFVEIYNQ